MIKWNNLQQLFKERGVKKKLSEATNISTGNISDWFNPNKNAQPSAEALVKMAEYFNCSVDYLLDRTCIKEVQKQYSDKIIPLMDMGEVISIDTYIEKVSAGKGNTIMIGNKKSQLYPATKISTQATYAARITGDSMEPQFVNDDIIYVDDKKIPMHGDIGVFTYNGETYCKKYYAIDGVEKLISLNDLYKPIIIKNNFPFEKQGVVIGRFHAD